MARKEQLPEQRRADEEARQWWVRLREPGRSADLEQAFFAWLQSSPVHAEAYLRVAAGATTEFDLAPIPPAGLPPGRRSWLATTAVVVSLALLIGATVLWIQSTSVREIPLSASHGQRPTFRLDDGSEVTLAAESGATVRFSGSERLVHLDRGQAFFHVAKGDGRRFRVIAGDASVVATGTQFAVRISDAAETVTLIEGSVRVYADSLALIDEGARQSAVSRALQPGDEVTVARGHVSPVEKVNPQAAMAWRYGRLVAKSKPLSEVIDEYNRYVDRPLVLVDPAVGAIRVGGVFSLDDAESFLAFLRGSFGVQAHETESSIELSRSQAGTVPNKGAT